LSTFFNFLDPLYNVVYTFVIILPVYRLLDERTCARCKCNQYVIKNMQLTWYCFKLCYNVLYMCYFY